MKPMNQRTNEAGFTLLELLLVVGVGALLLIGGIATYRLVSEGNKVTDTTRMVMTIRNEAQNLSQGQGYTGVKSALEAAKILAPNQKNPFGGDLTIAEGDTLGISVAAIPPNACRKLAMSIKDYGVKLGGSAPPVDLAAASGLCGGEENTLAWTFP